ncbi:hypothetical protein AAMO2058_000232200 [Amorphochlora amoebiformis]
MRAILRRMERISRQGGARRGFSEGIGGEFGYKRQDMALLNHGSFGAAPASVLAKQAQFKKQFESQPDEWYFGGLLKKGLMSGNEKVATAINASTSQVCLVENLSVATTIVAQHWGEKLRKDLETSSLSERNQILMLDWKYGACKHCLAAYCTGPLHSGKIVEAKIGFPLLSQSEVLEAVERTLKSHKIRFAFIDHITSQPTALMPIRQIIALCRQYGVEEICVDGAHAFGILDSIDCKQLDADFYMSNCHKWGFAPHSATFLYCKHIHTPTLKHPIVSWFHGEGLQQEALWTGTRDYSAMLCVPDAIEFLQNWRSEDGNTAQQHNHQGVVRAAKMLSEAWETQPQDLELVSSMAMVELPKSLHVQDIPGVPGDGVRGRLRREYGIEAAIGRFESGNYVRLSHAVYNKTEDYERLRDAILDLVRKQ